MKEKGELLESIEALEKKVEEVNKQVEPLLKLKTEQLNAKLTEEEKAKLHLALTYSINSLFYCIKSIFLFNF